MEEAIGVEAMVDLDGGIAFEPVIQLPALLPGTGSGAVGGEVYPVNKVTLMAPWIALGAIILAGGVYLIRRRVHS